MHPSAEPSETKRILLCSRHYRRLTRRLAAGFVDDYNHRRLHSAIGYVTPADKLAGRKTAIFAERDRKLAAARERRAMRRREAALSAACETGTQRKASGVQGAAMSPLGLRERR